MKTILITNIDNEQVTITSSDLSTFKEVVLFDDNFDKCEVYDETDNAGWYYLQSALTEIEGREITRYDEDIDSILENFFESHLFPEQIYFGE